MKSQWLIYAVSFITLFAVILLFSFLISEYTPVKSRIILFGGDVILILSPYWLLPSSKQKAVLIPIWCISLFLLTNVLYFRYWDDLIPFASIFSLSSYNRLVIENVGSVFKWSDALFLIIPLLATISVVKIDLNNSTPQLHYRLCLFFGSMMVFIIVTFFSTYRIVRYWENCGEKVKFESIFKSRFKIQSLRTQSWHANGIVCYLMSQLLSLDKYQRLTNLSENECALVHRVLYNNSIDDENGDVPDDNRNKNLILIIVESLNSPVIGRVVDGKPITPVLDSLLRLSGTIQALNVVPQIKDGGSSDGQMIYNTGLLPVKSGATAMLFADTEYPSIVKQLKPVSSAEFIYEDKMIWNHAETTKAYGYDVLHDEDSLKRDSEIMKLGMDEALFKYALPRIVTMKQPFFAEITTLSMHSPFNDPAVSFPMWIDRYTEFGTLEKNYLRMTHYFDSQLGRFLDGLKANGLFENTIIVMVSDHDQRFKDTEMNQRYPIAFIALNTGITTKVDKEIRQCDVFPTILDIMKIPMSDYRGLGYSFLRNGYDDVKKRVTDDELFEASDLIIRSNYFETQLESTK